MPGENDFSNAERDEFSERAARGQALRAFKKKHGREAATDSDFEEVENIQEDENARPRPAEESKVEGAVIDRAYRHWKEDNPGKSLEGANEEQLADLVQRERAELARPTGPGIDRPPFEAPPPTKPITLNLQRTSPVDDEGIDNLALSTRDGGPKRAGVSKDAFPDPKSPLRDPTTIDSGVRDALNRGVDKQVEWEDKFRALERKYYGGSGEGVDAWKHTKSVPENRAAAILPSGLRDVDEAGKKIAELEQLRANNRAAKNFEAYSKEKKALWDDAYTDFIVENYGEGEKYKGMTGPQIRKAMAAQGQSVRTTMWDHWKDTFPGTNEDVLGEMWGQLPRDAEQQAWKGSAYDFAEDELGPWRKRVLDEAKKHREDQAKHREEHDPAGEPFKESKEAADARRQFWQGPPPERTDRMQRPSESTSGFKAFDTPSTPEEFQGKTPIKHPPGHFDLPRSPPERKLGQVLPLEGFHGVQRVDMTKKRVDRDRLPADPGRRPPAPSPVAPPRDPLEDAPYVGPGYRSMVPVEADKVRLRGTAEIVHNTYELIEPLVQGEHVGLTPRRSAFVAQPVGGAIVPMDWRHARPGFESPEFDPITLRPGRGVKLWMNKTFEAISDEMRKRLVAREKTGVDWPLHEMYEQSIQAVDPKYWDVIKGAPLGPYQPGGPMHRSVIEAAGKEVASRIDWSQDKNQIGADIVHETLNLLPDVGPETQASVRKLARELHSGELGEPPAVTEGATWHRTAAGDEPASTVRRGDREVVEPFEKFVEGSGGRKRLHPSWYAEGQGIRDVWPANAFVAAAAGQNELTAGTWWTDELAKAMPGAASLGEAIKEVEKKTLYTGGDEDDEDVPEYTRPISSARDPKGWRRDDKTTPRVALMVRGQSFDDEDEAVSERGMAEMREALKKQYGDRVKFIDVEKPTDTAMVKAIEEMGAFSKANPGAEGLIYMAGHGWHFENSLLDEEAQSAEGGRVGSMWSRGTPGSKEPATKVRHLKDHFVKMLARENLSDLSSLMVLIDSCGGGSWIQ